MKLFYLFSGGGAEKPPENELLIVADGAALNCDGVAVNWDGFALNWDGVALNWNGELLVGAAAAVVPAPKPNEDDPPNANVDGTVGTEPNTGDGAVDWDENAKPLVVPAGAADVWIGLVDVFDVAPKLNNDDVLDVEPKAGNDEIEVAGLSLVNGVAPNGALEPNAGKEVALLVEITGGANGLGGLLAPNANGALFDVVVVVVVEAAAADGKLKPDDDDDDRPVPNKDGAEVVVVLLVVAIEDVDASGKLLGNEKPLVVEDTGNVASVAAAAVVGTVVLAGKPNKFGTVDVVVDDDSNAVKDGAEALVPNENEGSFSAETVEVIDVAVVVANAVLPNDPNVIDVDTLTGDDGLVVIIEDAVEVLIAVVLFVDDNEPNDWNVEVLFVPIWKRLFELVVAVVPNKGVEANETLVVTGRFVLTFSLVVTGNDVIDDAPNNGRVVVLANEILVVTGGVERMLSLIIVGVGVIIGVDSNRKGVWVVVIGVDTFGSSTIISGNLLVVVCDTTGEGSIAKQKKENCF
jgi:hypothetical protein